MNKTFALLTLASAMTLAVAPASAAEYVCTVHCKTGSGNIEKITVTVNASSSDDAARTIDPQGHQVCRGAGYAKATDSTMSSSQCSRK